MDGQAREEFGPDYIVELRTNKSNPFVIFFEGLYELRNEVPNREIQIFVHATFNTMWSVSYGRRSNPCENGCITSSFTNLEKRRNQRSRTAARAKPLTDGHNAC